MTQNPYATFGAPGGAAGEMFEPAQRRTSVLAILSLIAGLLCFIPGAGALATIFGGAAVIFISQSRGRLGGLGLAITGIVLGLVFTLVQILIVVGASNALNVFTGRIIGPADAMVKSALTGDHTGGRTLLTKRASDGITNAQLDDFAQRVTAELGAYQGTPKSILEFFAGYGEVGPLLQPFQGGQNEFIPFPAKFDKGTALIVLQVDPRAMQSGNAGGGANVQFPVVNFAVVTGTPQNIKQIWLIPPEEGDKLKQPLGTSGSGSSSSAPPAIPEKPETPEVPDGSDEPGEAPAPAPTPAPAPAPTPAPAPSNP